MFLFLSPNEQGTAHLIIPVKKRSLNVGIWQQLTTKTTKIRLRYSNRAQRYFDLLLLINTFTHGKLKSELFWRLISMKHINQEIFVMRDCLSNCNGINHLYWRNGCTTQLKRMPVLILPAMPSTCRHRTGSINTEKQNKRSFAISQHQK